MKCLRVDYTYRIKHLLKFKVKYFSSFQSIVEVETDNLNFDNPQPVFDLNYYCNPANKLEIEENIKKRKSRGDINAVLNINEQLNRLGEGAPEAIHLREKLLKEINKLPNILHESIKDLSDNPRLMNTIGVKKEFNFKPKEFSDLTKNLRIARRDNLSNFTDHRSYFLMGQLADMESALICYTLKNLLSRNFHLLSVPDILPKTIIESCGMHTEGERTQVS